MENNEYPRRTGIRQENEASRRAKSRRNSEELAIQRAANPDVAGARRQLEFQNNQVPVEPQAEVEAVLPSQVAVPFESGENENFNSTTSASNQASSSQTPSNLNRFPYKKNGKGKENGFSSITLLAVEGLPPKPISINVESSCSSHLFFSSAFILILGFIIGTVYKKK